MEWKKLLALAGGAAGVAAVLYYLLREEPERRGAVEDDKKKAFSADQVTKEQVLQILGEIVESQEKMRTHMKALTRDIIEKNMDFDKTYDDVRAVQPDDPLERIGLSMTDFDSVLSKYQADPQVREGITRIMGISDPGAAGSGAVKDVNDQRVIEVHAFMLKELEGLVSHFTSIKGQRSYDMKIVTLALQAMVGAKVETRFGLTSDDIESAVIKNHSKLATNQEFANINVNMQQTIANLMGPMAP
jgi:hypothetical protein